MIETEESSKGQIKTSDDSFNDRVDTLIEDLIKTNIEENVENTCKTCHKTIKDDIDNNNILEVQKKTGMIFQEFNLVNNLSAINNVLTGLLNSSNKSCRKRNFSAYLEANS